MQEDHRRYLVGICSAAIGNNHSHQVGEVAWQAFQLL